MCMHNCTEGTSLLGNRLFDVVRLPSMELLAITLNHNSNRHQLSISYNSKLAIAMYYRGSPTETTMLPVLSDWPLIIDSDRDNQ